MTGSTRVAQRTGPKAAAADHRRSCMVVSGQSLKELNLSLPVSNVSPPHAGLVGLFGSASMEHLGDVDQTIRVSAGHALEHGRVDDAEDGCVGPDSDRQREAGRASEKGLADEQTQGLAQVCRHVGISERHFGLTESCSSHRVGVFLSCLSRLEAPQGLRS